MRWGAPRVCEPWEQTELLRRYGRLEEQLGLCYPALRLQPTPAELQELFAAVG